MRGLFIDADACRSGKSVGEPRRGASAEPGQQFLADGIQFARGHSRLNGVEHFVKDKRHDSTNALKRLDVGLGFDGHEWFL